jgi:hypothetical protein
MEIEDARQDSYLDETDTSRCIVYSLDYKDQYLWNRYLESHNLVNYDIDQSAMKKKGIQGNKGIPNQ